jgi:ribonuclease J
VICTLARKKKALRIIPIGGVGEIGKNMMAVEYGDDLLVIDAGLMFPESDMLGIDIVIPDIGYLLDKKDKIRAILITHGHEDHTGGLPYILPQINAPIYATPLTRGLIEVKLKEFGLLSQARLHTVRPGDTVALGAFQVEFFQVSHSIPDGVGLAITTPVGLVVHSGDFKFDHSPVDDRRTDFAKLAELGGRGVLVLLSDSTRTEYRGYTPSEQEVSRTFEQVFTQTKGRILIATFASNISRVQQVIDTAEHFGRRVAVLGRSMAENVAMAVELGYLRLPRQGLLPIGEVNRISPGKVTIVCTGSQGEPTSALVRIANGEYRGVAVSPGDAVIVSATPIPGNEELVHRTLNRLFRLGADVYYSQLLDVHVSGHASQEEQKLMLNLIRPRYFVPIHGEYRHLVLHARLARQVGVPPENIFVVENGHILEFDGKRGRVVDRFPGGYVFVDGLGVGDVGHVVLRDRHLLSQDGFLIAVVGIDRESGEVLSGPDIITRGFVYARDAEPLIAQAKEQVLAALRKGRGRDEASTRIKERLSTFLYEQTKRRPMILPVVMEI